MREEAAAVLAAAPPAAPSQPPALSLEEAFPPPASLLAAAAGGRPPRPPPAPAAAAAAPGPAPAAAAVQPQGVWAQKPAVAVVTTAAPPPPPPRPAAQAVAHAPTTTAAAAAAAPAGKEKPTVVVVPVQPAAADERLSRAQRKNLKRAEKKAAAAAAAAEKEAPGAAAADSGPASPASDGSAAAAAVPAALEPAAAAAPAAPAPAPSAAAAQEPGALPAQSLGESFERCLQALVQHKLSHQVEQLQQLGFAAPAALAAVQQHGGNLEAALVTLLEQVGKGGACSPAVEPAYAPALLDLWPGIAAGDRGYSAMQTLCACPHTLLLLCSFSAHVPQRSCIMCSARPPERPPTPVLLCAGHRGAGLDARAGPACLHRPRRGRPDRRTAGHAGAPPAPLFGLGCEARCCARLLRRALCSDMVQRGACEPAGGQCGMPCRCR